MIGSCEAPHPGGLRLRRAVRRRYADRAIHTEQTSMKNPWIKKNPFMSMWLSGANTILGRARSQAVAEARRQSAAMMTEGARQMFQFWTGSDLAPPRRKRKKSR